MSDGFQRLRVEQGGEPELRCPHCNEWWPITVEFWRINAWDRCRSCKQEADRLRATIRRLDPDYQKRSAEYQRRYRNYVRRTAPGLLEAYDRERRARKREWLREYRSKDAA